MWGCGQNAPWTVFIISGLSDVMFFFLEKAQSDFQQLIYRNVQPEQVTEGEGCDEPKCSDRPCDQSCDHEEEEEPLMKTNNYQFCWVRPKTGKPIWFVNKQWESWISRGTAAPSGPQDSCSYFFLFVLFVCPSSFHVCPPDRQAAAEQTCDLLLCRAWLRFATQQNMDPQKGHTRRQITQASKAALLQISLLLTVYITSLLHFV